jgi:hypothetical protein
MRRKHTSQGLAVRAIAGTHAVLLAMDYPEARCPGLLGFGIHRTDHTEEEAYWLSGTKVFPSADPGLAPGSQVPTRDHPIQDFSWGDYSAKPGHTYTYRVAAFKGTPGAPVPVAQVKVKVTAESPAGGDHDIYFNRGTGASQVAAPLRGIGLESAPRVFHLLKKRRLPALPVWTRFGRRGLPRPGVL